MLRIKEFHAVNFRSLADVRLTDLPSIVLLYGENNTGKSNLLRAVGAWLRLASWAWGASRDNGKEPSSLLAFAGAAITFDLTEDESKSTVGTLLGWPAHAQFRRDAQGIQETTLTLDGALDFGSEDTPKTLSMSFRATLSGSDIDIKVERCRTTDGANPPIDWTDMQMPPWEVTRFFRSALTGPWLRISAQRTFHEELLPTGTGDSAVTSNNGDGLLLSLFRAFASSDRAKRERFQRFSKMFSSGPIQLDEPRPVLLENTRLGLQIGDDLVADLGSGAQQWALLAGMMAMSDSPILRIEEPEANLSYRATVGVVDWLVREVNESRSAPYQIFVTSHSGNTFNLAPNEVWYSVSKANSATSVTRCHGREALTTIFPEAPVPPPRVTSILPGNFLWIPPDLLNHLGARVGDLLQVILDPQGEIRFLRTLPNEPIVANQLVVQPGNYVWLPNHVLHHLNARVGDLLQPLLGPTGELRWMNEERFEQLLVKGSEDTTEDGQ
ncbi:MAG: AAA family ATPase [Polyangiaceae bacterium]|nr:AAA family ATPase [Polyangiaceae bacterium]